jgi:hypothetical protein
MRDTGIGMSRVACLLFVGLLARATPAEAQDAKQPTPGATTTLLDRIVESKCKTSLCFADNWLGFEPLLDLPTGASLITLPMGEDQGLGDYIKTHPLNASFKGGVRMWLFHDVVGIGVYYSSQSYRPDSDPNLRLRGSTFEYPASQIRRPYPGVALTFLAGMAWIGLDIDELTNRDVDAGRDPDYPRNWAVNRVGTLTFGISPASVLKDLVGLGNTPEKSVASKEAPPAAAPPAAPPSEPAPAEPAPAAPASAPAPAPEPAPPAPVLPEPPAPPSAGGDDGF